MKSTKTNAMRLLDTLKIPYTSHTYATGDALDGVSVAHKAGRNPAQVFKTLVSRGASGGVYVFCISADKELHLKSAALAANEKSLAMIPLAELLPLTGYRKGGCSPLCMKKKYPTFLDICALQQTHILVSGGQVGLQIELHPADLQHATGAQFFENGK